MSHVMLDHIGKAAMLEQTAEEATELAQAALKYARILRQENPTPVTEDEAQMNLKEEWNDLLICASQLNEMDYDMNLANKKIERFVDRWNTFNFEKAHAKKK